MAIDDQFLALSLFLSLSHVSEISDALIFFFACEIGEKQQKKKFSLFCVWCLTLIKQQILKFSYWDFFSLSLFANSREKWQSLAYILRLIHNNPLSLPSYLQDFFFASSFFLSLFNSFYL